MPARPKVGMQFRQEYYAGHAEDMARVLSLDEQAEVPAGHFTDVLLTREWNPLEPEVLEYKLYANGMGQGVGDRRVREQGRRGAPATMREACRRESRSPKR